MTRTLATLFLAAGFAAAAGGTALAQADTRTMIMSPPVLSPQDCFGPNLNRMSRERFERHMNRLPAERRAPCMQMWERRDEAVRDWRREHRMQRQQEMRRRM